MSKDMADQKKIYTEYTTVGAKEGKRVRQGMENCFT